jgi:hypothetical protein
VVTDRGDRIYHDTTVLKREIRGKCTLADELMVEVDMHASFVAALTPLYARGDERERLIAMLRTGDFYSEFAKLAGDKQERSTSGSCATWYSARRAGATLYGMLSEGTFQPPLSDWREIGIGAPW